MVNHILQSKYWAEFKKDYGSEVIHAGGIYYTKHKIPFLNMYFAYCPRVNPFVIDFNELKESLKKEKCIGLRFDVPNVSMESEDYDKAKEIFEEHCIKAPRDEFARGNFILDLTLSEEELLNNMHHKLRYNIKLAEKKGLKVKRESQTSLDIFYELYKKTATRQGYFYRPKAYFSKLWDIFKKADIGHIVIIEYNNTPLASWMLFNYEGILYYPYGGSSEEYRNLQASSYIGWEAIKIGKKLGCKIFDMWGAAYNIDDKKDPYYGFTTFKSHFGGKHIKYIRSYDLVINSFLYKIFNLANNLRWKFLKSLR